MERQEFKALVVEEINGTYQRAIKTKRVNDLPEGDLLIRVHYSSLNYKDALSANGNKGVTRKYPHTPGIDAVGTVITSHTAEFEAQDKVIVTGYDLGMNTDGGFGQCIRVPGEWAIKLPENLSMKEAMALGTAGLTAGMAVLRLVDEIEPKDGEIVVSGATGGVGVLGISLLKKLGYSVTAITGKMTERNFLLNVGADSVMMRQEFETIENKPLLKPIFAGALDTVGGVILQNMIKSTKSMGVVTCCGNVASPNLELTVYPFILRGVSLIGIDSQNYPWASRELVWNKLSEDWKPDKLADTYTEITLPDLNEKIDLMLSGRLTGRTLVNMEAYI